MTPSSGLSQSALSKMSGVFRTGDRARPAAVHRSADEREPWNPAESVTPAEAFAASTDGQPTSASEARG